MLRSLYSGVSGLTAHQTKMDVIGNNIANVNTYGFKSSRVTFSDIYYQNIRNATQGTSTVGGNNPSQVGYGVTVGTIDTVMSRSGFQMTDSGLDLAIAGEGFFQVQDKVGNRFYTRAGILAIDNYGNLVDAKGNFVLGVTGDPTGQAASSDKIQIFVPNVVDAASSATKTLLGSTVSIKASVVGDAGNITINFVHGTPPTASMSGDNVTVTFDQSAKYPDLASLQSAIDEAIRNGGVTLPTGDLQITVEPAPADTAKPASNYVLFGSTADDKLTITAGADGKSGNAINIKYKTIDSGTASAEWDGDSLVFTLVKDDNYTAADLQALADAANTAAGIAAGDVKALTFSGLGNAVTGLALAEKPVKLGGGDNTYFENIAGMLGTIKLDGGRTAAEQTVGNLSSLAIGSDGVITATHSVHGQLILGRIDLVTFDNPAGLEQAGDSYFKQTSASGGPRVCQAGYDGSGDIVSSALEMSNVDLAQEFADMITTQRGFQANSRIITTSDEILQELVNLKR